jgi:ribosomal-protein-serine acetyltransferase
MHTRPGPSPSSHAGARLDFRGLRCGALVLHRIDERNLPDVRLMFAGLPDSAYMLAELTANYQPEYDDERRQTLFGFYTTLRGELVGSCLLGISSFAEARGFTGADTLVHRRGQGIAPASKPALFYLGFALLGLNRIETGCFASNVASRRSMEKTPGLLYEGTLRKYARNAQGVFEDEHRFAIVRSDWITLYGRTAIEVLPRSAGS